MSKLARHEEIRLALRYFLESYFRAQTQGTVPDPSRVLHDFARYKGLSPVVERLATRPRQVARRSREEGGGRDD